MLNRTVVFLVGSAISGLLAIIIFFNSGIKPGEIYKEEIDLLKDEKYYETASDMFLEAFRSWENELGQSALYFSSMEDALEEQYGTKTQEVASHEGKPKSFFWILAAAMSGICLTASFVCQYFYGEMRKEKLKYWRKKSLLAVEENKKALESYKKFNEYYKKILD